MQIKQKKNYVKNKLVIHKFLNVKENIFKSFNRDTFLYSSELFSVLNFLLLKKNIFISKNIVLFSTNICCITLFIYFKTNTTLIYKKLLKKLSLNIKASLFSRNAKLFTFFVNTNLKVFKNSLVNLKIYNLNTKINKKIIFVFYKELKFFKQSLFIRRYSLFIDFFKMTSLFLISKINLYSYLFLLADIFRFLHKKKHSKYILFLKNLFLKLHFYGIKGLKLTINGKLKGKTRASTVSIIVGSVPIQTVDKAVLFKKTHVYTLYGVFGFKLWLHIK
jgi:hypothetical protein